MVAVANVVVLVAVVVVVAAVCKHQNGSSSNS